MDQRWIRGGSEVETLGMTLRNCCSSPSGKKKKTPDENTSLRGDSSSQQHRSERRRSPGAVIYLVFHFLRCWVLGKLVALLPVRSRFAPALLRTRAPPSRVDPTVLYSAVKSRESWALKRMAPSSERHPNFITA